MSLVKNLPSDVADNKVWVDGRFDGWKVFKWLFMNYKRPSVWTVPVFDTRNDVGSAVEMNKTIIAACVRKPLQINEQT